MSSILCNRVLPICISYIRTYTPKILGEGDFLKIVYEDEKGNTFEKSIRKFDSTTIKEEDYYKSKFENIKEEARLWLIKQNEVVK